MRGRRVRRTPRARTLRFRSQERDPRTEIAESDHARPRTRGECIDGARPCPFVGCRYNLFLDVTPSGSIKLNYPTLEPWELAESCALDVADRGEHTLEAVGLLLNLTRERIRQVMSSALLGPGIDLLRKEAA